MENSSDLFLKNHRNQLLLKAEIVSRRLGKNGTFLPTEESKEFHQRKEDSGYLSTDSNESKKKAKDSDKETVGGGSETDESLGDGHSESGAESVETHSVFFGSYRKSSYVSGSIDSGVGGELKTSDLMLVGDECGGASSDSEAQSYATVVPLCSSRSSISSVS